MRILMVNKYLYPRAGAETYMITVAEALLAAGHQVAFFGMAHPDNTRIGPSATVPFLEFGRSQPTAKRLANIGKAFAGGLAGTTRHRLETFCQTWKPDLIHAHNIYNQLPPSMFRGAARHIPVLMTVHDYKPVCPNYSLFVDGATCTECVGGSVMPCVKKRCCQGSLFASGLAAASALHHRHARTYHRDYHWMVSPSHFVRERLIDGGLDGERIQVIHNFAAIPEHFTAPGTGLFYGGRLCVEKGVDVLLKGYAMLPAPRPRLRIAGDGPLAESLQALSRELGLETVTWLGRIKPEEVLSELDQAAVAAVPSTWFENCSMAIMESLAMGRAVLASNAGGNPDLVRPGIDGEVFEAGSPESVRDALLRLFNEYDLKALGRAAREAAQARFSPSVHLKQLLTAYANTERLFRKDAHPSAPRPQVAEAAR